MDFLILVGQRKCRYDGEYAPEALQVIDDIGNSDNPDFLLDEKEKATASGEFDSVSILTVRVPDASVTECLYPAQRPVRGEVIGAKAEAQA